MLALWIAQRRLDCFAQVIAGLALLMAFCGPSTAPAASLWQGGVSSNWNDGGNWDAAPGAGADLIFTDNVPANLPTNNDIVGGDFNSITFNTNYTGPLAIGGQDFTLGAGGLLQSNAALVSMSSNITLPVDAAFNVGAGNLTLTGSISGSNTITKSGPGTLRLEGTSTHSGAISMTGGTLEFTSAAALGAAVGGFIHLSTGPVRYVGTNPLGDTIQRDIRPAVVSNNADFYLLEASGVGPLTVQGTFINSGLRRGALGGTGVGIMEGTVVVQRYRKEGPGTWIFAGTGNNTAGQESSILAGTLIAAKDQALGSGTNANYLIVSNGATLGFQGNINDVTRLRTSVIGTGDAGNGRAGAIDNISGNNSFLSVVHLQGNATFGATSGTLTLNGEIAEVNPLNSFGITKNGPGTIVLAKATGNIYKGNTTIDQGTLVAANTSGSATGTGDVLVNSGGTLAGFGSVAGSVVVAGGSLAPGLSPGALTIGGDLELGAGSDYFWQIDDWDGAPTVNYDTLSIAGSLDITATSGNPFTLHLEALTLDPIPEGTWTIATAAGGITGLTGSNYVIDTSSLLGPITRLFSLSLANGNTELVLVSTSPPIPEASSFSLLALGCVVLRRQTARRSKN